MSSYEVRPIGRVQSTLKKRKNAPRQPDENAPSAWLLFEPEVRGALRDVRPGDQMDLLTWLHEARRETLVVRPRRDPSRSETGVFSTRSPDRPNPIGVHRVVITAVEDLRVQVQGLEAIDGTPILDLKERLAKRPEDL